MKGKCISGVLVLMLMVGIIPATQVYAATDKNIEVNQVVTDSLDTGNEVDVFRFYVDQYGVFTPELTYDGKGDYTVTISKAASEGDSDIVSVNNYSYTGTSSSTVAQMGRTFRYNAGYYVVNVARKTSGTFSDSGYSLKINYTAEKNNVELQPNETFLESTEIEVNKVITGNLDTLDDLDYYSFTTYKNGKLQLELDYDYSGEYSVTLFKGDSFNKDEEMFSNIFEYSGTSADGRIKQYSSVVRHEPGDFYLQVKKKKLGKYSNSDYKFSMKLVEENTGYERESNNNEDLATDLKTNVGITGNMENVSDLDFYKFTMPMDGTIIIQLKYDNNGEYYARLHKLDEKSSLIRVDYYTFSNSGKSGMVSEKSDKYNVEAGDYYVEVMQENDGDYSNSDYVMTVLSNILTENVPSSWAREEVQAAIDTDLVPESLQNSYTDNITRKEFSSLVVNLITTKLDMEVKTLLSKRGVKIDENAFSDTSDYNVLIANALGIVNGKGDGVFDPSGNITRQEAAIMLLRSSKILGVVSTNADTVTFNDMNRVADWAKVGVEFVANRADISTAKRVMGGVGNNEFSPETMYTREQSYLTIIRLFRSYE